MSGDSKTSQTSQTSPSNQLTSAMQEMHLDDDKDYVVSEPAGSVRYVFEETWIDQLQRHAKTPMKLEDTFTFDSVFTLIEPATARDDIEIISLGFLPNKSIVLVGLTRIACSNEATEQKTIKKHLAELRKLKSCAKAPIVLIVENSYGGGLLTEKVMSYADDFAPVVRMCSTIGQCGVRTTVKKLNQAIEIGRHELAKGTIHFADQVACADPDNYATIRDAVIAQLAHIHKKDFAGLPMKESLYCYSNVSIILECLFWAREYQNSNR